MQLDVKNYNWKEKPDSEPKLIGLIAQEVQPLFPSLVWERKNKRTGQSTLTLDYTTFGVLAVGAIKELRQEKDKEIAALKKTISSLKGASTSLKKTMTSLKEENKAMRSELDALKDTIAGLLNADE